tara:strand:+ start:278 stop:460 length:183 start_codon:yes stop_codon:yes gene_type:complete
MKKGDLVKWEAHGRHPFTEDGHGILLEDTPETYNQHQLVKIFWKNDIYYINPNRLELISD